MRLQVAITHYCHEGAMPARPLRIRSGWVPDWTRWVRLQCQDPQSKAIHKKGEWKPALGGWGGGRFPGAQAYCFSSWILAIPTLNQCLPRAFAGLSGIPILQPFSMKTQPRVAGVMVQPKGGVGGKGTRRSRRFYLGQRWEEGPQVSSAGTH